MSPPKLLTHYFKPLNSGGVKRSFSDLVSGEKLTTELKENKNLNKEVCNELNKKSDDVPPPSPDEKMRMKTNQVLAKIKLQSKKTCALHPNIGISWFQAIEAEFKKPYFTQLSNYLAEERAKYTIFPPENHVWSWTHHFEISQTKVVIIGQDPYHGPGQAHGLCFSVLQGVAAPPSLVNIFKELVTDVDGFQVPNHGNLTSWAKQGVLLLNAGLTVRSGAANSHKDQGWETLTDSVIQWISNNCRGVVFLLWGAYAQKKASIVDKKKHHLLNAPHPSPLSAHRGFFGSKHFSQCNQLLLKQGKTPIDWSSIYSG